jgi:hypothetical protein
MVYVSYDRWCILGLPRMLGLTSQGVHRLQVWSWASSAWQSTIPSSTTWPCQHRAVPGNREWAHECARAEWGALWGRTSIAPQLPGHEHVLLRLLGSSSTSLFWGKGLAWGRWLAPHHRIKIWYVTLHRVPKDSVCYPVAERSSRGLVGIVYHNTATRSPCVMGWVPSCFLWSPPISGYNTPQAFRVPGSAPGELFYVWVHPGV